MHKVSWIELAVAACNHADVRPGAVETIAKWDEPSCANAVYRMNGQHYLKLFGQRPPACLRGLAGIAHDAVIPDLDSGHNGRYAARSSLIQVGHPTIWRYWMNMPKWISWAGLAAIVGGLTAVLLTPPFASAYFTAYPGYETPPFWIEPLRPALGNLLTFAAPRTVYNWYGRLFVLVYLLMLPAVFALHILHQGARGRAEKWGYHLLVAGLLLACIGVVSDYWAGGAGFLFEVLGLLIFAIGATVYGAAALRVGLLPGKVAWPLALALPAVFLAVPLIRHIPSGPTFPLAIVWFIIGAFLLFVGEKRPQLTV